MTAFKLETVPPELFLHITGQLAHADRLALSGTCSTMRGMLKPGLFRYIRITNDHDAPWQDLEALAASVSEGPACPIESLCFEGSVKSLVLKKDFDPSVPVLPGVARRALAGELFSASSVRVRFDFGGFEERTYEDEETGKDCVERWEHESEFLPGGDVTSIYVFEVPEPSKDAVQEKERTYPWRSLMNEVWEALTANVNVVGLLAEGLPPKAASTWYTPAWASLMGRLEELEISMWYGDNGAGWMSNTLENYIDFESRRLREYFLQHCRRLRRLRLVAGPQTGFGDASGLDNFNGPLPLEQGDLPALRRLELKNLFVSEQLALFILRTDEAERSGQAESGDRSDRECNQNQEERIAGPCEGLRSLQVLNCHVHPRSTIGTWAVFFDMLRTGQQAGGRRHGRHELCELDVTYRYGSETIPWVHSHDEAPWAWTVDRDAHGADVTGDSEPGEPEEDERVLAIRSSERCAFSYALPTDKYGDVWLCCDELFQAFERGNDYRAYAALMDSVERNRVKGGSHDSGE